MKRILYLTMITLSFGLLFTSCSDDDETIIENNYYYESEVFEFTGDFVNDGNGWYMSYILDPAINQNSSVLLYRLNGIDPDVWQLVPRTFHLGEDIDGDGLSDELDYDYDFSHEDILVYARGTYDLILTPDYIDAQTFRVVVIIGNYTGAKGVNPVDYEDYNAVIKYYGIDDSNVKTIK